MAWRITGTYYAPCSCNVGCPCILGEMQGNFTRLLHGAAAFRDDIILARGTGSRSYEHLGLVHDPEQLLQTGISYLRVLPVEPHSRETVATGG